MATLDRDGTTLFYDEVGSGGRPIVFIHGWCCNHTYFAPQFDHFRESHRVVAVDLRGHGASDKPEQDYSTEGFADDIAWMCDALDLRKPIVIGHSLGGTIALQLAAQFPELPLAIVMVDPAPIIPAPGVTAQLAPIVEALHGEGYREAQRAFIENGLFLSTDDTDLKARVVKEMGSAPQHVMASALAHVNSWDGEPAVRALGVPALMILAGEGFSDVARIRELCPDLVIGRTVGAGHFHQLLVPEQVNAMIERFLAISLPASVSASSRS
jgi:pimeloyl-ACP methyl ester carboxylesterase